MPPATAPASSGRCEGGDVACYAAQSVHTLLRQYQHWDDGLFGETMPWIEANGIETVCDWAIRLGGPEGSPEVAALWPNITRMLERGANVTQPQYPADHSDSCGTPYCGHYDDQGWWGLAWAKAYELTHDERYLYKAVGLFVYLRNNSWDDTTCGGGGNWWSGARTYKNSVTSELFFALAARLHPLWLRHQPQQAALGTAARPVAGAASPRHYELDDRYFLEWALRAWQWIEASELRDSRSGLFRDGLNSSQCGASSGNDDGANATWTYNQGIVLGGIADLFAATGDHSLLRFADELILAVMEHMTVPGGGGGGILDQEGGEPAHILVEWACGTCGGCAGIAPAGACAETWDSAMFKGAFMRFLGYLRRTPTLDFARASIYRRFAAANAASCWEHARSSSRVYARAGPPQATMLFGNDWRGPYEAADVATSQIAALGLFASLL